MKLIKLTPRGFCTGVVNAWKITQETINKFPKNKVYMLGLFVHNPKMLNELTSYGNVIILDDSKTSRYELVNSFKTGKDKILLLSAHGTDEKTIKLAKKKQFTIVDTTCEFVYKTHNLIKDSLKQRKTVIYLGVLNHPESNATIKISKKIKFVYRLEQLHDLKSYFNKRVVVANQTTLSIHDLKSYYDYIRNHFTNYELHNDLCDATLERQNAILNLNTHIDILIVVGSHKSNNCQQLLKLGKLKKIKECVLVNDLAEAKQLKISQHDCVAITSGASTPTRITNEIINYLENLSWN